MQDGIIFSSSPYVNYAFAFSHIEINQMVIAIDIHVDLIQSTEKKE